MDVTKLTVDREKADEILSFLEKIGSDGYGGMSDYELALQAARDLVHAEAIAESAIPKHNWVRSTLGHGETMCTRCFITNREAAVLGLLNFCEPKDDVASR